MIEPNSRIEHKNGIRFYEQDVLYDNYVFTKNIEIEMTIDYLNSGFGIAFIDSEGYSLEDKKEAYLFKLGYLESSVLYKNGASTYELSKNSVNIKPKIKNQKIIIAKYGRSVRVYKKGSTENLISYTLNRDIDRFCIGYYSNAGNVIKDIIIKSNCPEGWSINLRNSIGGYIKFLNDSFEVTDCKYPCEIQQDKVFLKAGTYYLNYNSSSINNNYDIKCYVFKSENIELIDDIKNILISNSFTLEEDTNVSIRFTGTTGKISNIKLTDIKEDVYISTTDNINISEGGLITFDTTNINRIKLKSKIKKIPLSDEENAFFILKTDNIVLKHSDLSMLLNMTYNIYVYPRLNKITICDKNENILEEKNIYISDSIEMLYNYNLEVSEFLITTVDNLTKDMLQSSEDKVIISTKITSPIIVVDENNIPLDLSSSYRYYEREGKTFYEFTNTEREIFDSSNILSLEKEISKEYNNIKIYGIKEKSLCNFSYIYKTDMKLNNIDYFCPVYDVINSKDIIIDGNNTVRVESFEEYELILIDYLKNDSYCVNRIPDTELYEVSISSNKEAITVMHDFKIDQINNIQSNYIKTTIVPNDNTYVILKRGD